jgi:hypothetical protein
LCWAVSWRTVWSKLYCYCLMAVKTLIHGSEYMQVLNRRMPPQCRKVLSGNKLGNFLTDLLRINVTLRRVHQTTVAVAKQCYTFWVCVDLVIQHAKAHTPWPVWVLPYIFFSHYLVNDTIFEKKVIEHKMRVLISSTNWFWNFSHCKKNWARHYNKCT